MSRFVERLRWRIKDLMTVSDEVANRLEAHYRLLERWNARMNLTAIRDMEEAIDRHYAESLYLATRLAPGKVVDIGSGAGFPGAPIAMYRPELSLTLVESHARKAVFLRESTRDLPNVTVRPERIEQVNAVFDTAVMRAVLWKDVARRLPLIASSAALLVSTENAEEVRASWPAFSWQQPISLPWSASRVILVGNRAAP